MRRKKSETPGSRHRLVYSKGKNVEERRRKKRKEMKKCVDDELYSLLLLF